MGNQSIIAAAHVNAESLQLPIADLFFGSQRSIRYHGGTDLTPPELAAEQCGLPAALRLQSPSFYQPTALARAPTAWR